MVTISKPFLLDYDVPEGCASCGRELYEKDAVQWVGGKLTCRSCVDRMIGETVIGQKARRKREK